MSTPGSGVATAPGPRAVDLSDLPAGEPPRPVITVGEGLGLIRSEGVGTFAQIGQASVSTGGAEANVAIALARLGVPVTWMGRVGNDSLGRRVLRELRAEGVHTLGIVDEAATALMLKETPRPGRSKVTFYRTGSAGSRLSPADIDGLDIAGARLVHLTGILPALSAAARAAALHLLEAATTAGVAVSFDVNHRSRLWTIEEAAPVYRAIATRAHIVFGGLEELTMLVNGPVSDGEAGARHLAEAVRARGVPEVVVKLGAAGAGVLDADGWHRQDGEPVAVLDTVGAGDSFVAAYLATRLAGQAVGQALHAGVRAGAMACTYPGDWEGSPSSEELTAEQTREPVER